MLKYTVRRLLLIIPTLFFVALITFVLAHAAPGGPWDKNELKPIPEQVQDRLNRMYGLDRPLHEQFLLYIWNAAHLDFGVSYTYKDRQVSEIIAREFPVSAQLGIQALLVALAIAVPLGVVSALKQNTVVDYASLLFATAGYSVPSFVLAIFAIFVFAVQLHLVPVVGWGKLENMVLPTVLLGVGSSAFLTRLTRASMLEVLRQDYVRTARSKGLREQVVIVRHVVKNALIPVATVLGPATAAIITGTFIIETMFNVPGLGRRFVSSIISRDYTLILGVYLLYALIVTIANLTVDLVYALLDPRIKVSR